MCDCVWIVWMDDFCRYHRFCGAYSTPQGAFDSAGRIMLEEYEQAKEIGLADQLVFELAKNNTEYLATYSCNYFDEYIHIERVLLDDDR